MARRGGGFCVGVGQAEALWPYVLRRDEYVSERANEKPPAPSGTSISFKVLRQMLKENP